MKQRPSVSQNASQEILPAIALANRLASISASLLVTRRLFLVLCAFALMGALSGCGGSSSSSSPVSYKVGRTSFDWIDTNRTEKYGPNPGGPRKIVAYVWYPASPAQNATPGPFLSEIQATVLSSLAGLPKETLLSLPTKSYINAPPVTNGASFPVLLMSHGNTGAPLYYSYTAEYLATRGYIVVGISHTYNAQWTIFGDNTVALADSAADVSSVPPVLSDSSSFADIRANRANSAALDADLTKDASFALDKLAELNRTEGVFKGRLNLNQVGMFGHSFGGSHSFRMLQENSRVLAAADLDGTIFNEDFAQGVSRPFMVQAGGHPTDADLSALRAKYLAAGMTAAQADEIISLSNSPRIAFENSRSAYFVRLNKAEHGNFTDFGLLASYGLPQDDISTTASAESLLNASNEYLVAFFDEKLRGLYAPLLHRASVSADITFERRP